MSRARPARVVLVGAALGLVAAPGCGDGASSTGAPQAPPSIRPTPGPASSKLGPQNKVVPGPSRSSR